MADAPHIPNEAETRAKWGNFAWSKDNAKTAAMYVARYPAGRQQSAVMALLDLAQRQVGEETKTQGWLPVPVIEYVAAQLCMPYMRAYEVVTFYTMYNLAPVGRYHVQVCGTTPCLLRGSDDVLAACKNRGLVKGGTTPDARRGSERYTSRRSWRSLPSTQNRPTSRGFRLRWGCWARQPSYFFFIYSRASRSSRHCCRTAPPIRHN